MNQSSSCAADSSSHATTTNTLMSIGSDLQHDPPRPRSSSSASAQQHRRPASPPHQHPHHPQIRHCGRAQIRGKIRRVWRPRYLELWDSAVVRYYELPPAADAGAPPSVRDALHINMIPKYTLRVFAARILDVTTLRDMHVGLPQGSYGFVFRGQRLVHLEEQLTAGTPLLQQPPDDLTHPRPSYPPDASEDPGSTSSAAGAATELLAAPRRNNSSALSSSTTAVSSLLLNNLQCGGAPEGQEPRDFFCAVRTLEEAQMWVVALQWASEQQQSSHSVPNEPWWEVESDEWVGAVPASSVPVAASLPAQRNRRPRTASQEATAACRGSAAAAGDIPTSSRPRAATAPSGAATAAATAEPGQPQTTPSSDAPAKPGKVVVARVVDCRLVRVPALPLPDGNAPTLSPQWWRSLVAGWHLEVAYEIHALLIQNRQVEQLVLWRTARDVSHLLQALASSAAACAETPSSTPSPRLVRLCQQLPSDPDRWSQNVSIVDSVVRSLVLDASAVNNAAMKEFLGLLGASSETTAATVPARWHLHDRRHVASRTTTTLSTTAEDYVRQWLQDRNRRSPSNSTQWDAWIWNACQTCGTPSRVMAAVGLSVLVPCAAARLWQCLPCVTLRLDTLVGSWIAAAYFGREYEQRRPHRSSLPQRPPPSRSVTTRKERQRAAADASETREAQPYAQLEEISATTPRSDGAEDDVNEDVEVDEEESDGEDLTSEEGYLSEAASEKLLGSPLPEYPANHGLSCWSKPRDDIFHVRGPSYLQDRIKIPSEPGPLKCRGVDVWMTDNPERHIARHPSVLGGKLGEVDTFLVNFLLPFGNFVAYFSIPPLEQFPDKLRNVWTNFLKGDQQYRDARLKLLPVVVDGPWIVKTAVGGGKSPALLGKAIPLQYFFRDPDRDVKGVYEVDVIITASTIAKGILSVVKGHTKCVSIAFAFIIEASEEEELPETVLCSFQVHSLYLEDCPILPECNLDLTGL